ncbi:DNA excision repair protein ERCC-1 isoform X4 [Poecile atricapillus]|uniref:DNA excision repair protein ERCC-1 isoform X4 n=1 Tax=Poecile atricapillus TaxID=48891 RepID=UPI002739E33E|nr:DNA excision repair protein ERCC-1 isoform X4 [Poecile atricapillus]
MDPDPDPNPGSAADPEPAAEPEPAPAPAGKRRRFTLRQEGPEEPPVPSLFRAGAAAPPVPVPVPVPPGAGSYAEFVVRGSGSTGRAQPGAERNRGEREQNRERDRDREQNRDQNRDREQNRDQNREVPALPVLKPGTRSSSIIVSPRQRGNPVLRFIRNVPWEFGDVVPDYVLGQSSCALFLSLRYHQLHPEYIHERLRALGRSFSLQVLLLQVDVRDPLQALQDLARICLLSDCTLLLAWSAEESGRYLETFKCYEQKPPDLLRERVEPDFLSRSLAAVAAASPQDLSLCPGVGPQKARRLFDVLHQPFLKSA